MPCDDSCPALPDKTGSADYIAVGTIGKAVGLKGECRIVPFGGTLERIKLPVSLKAGCKEPEMTVVLKALIKQPKGYKAFFGGHESRESVERIKNHTLFIEKDRLPFSGSNEFYHFELEGMDVISEGLNETIGSVIHVHNYPTVDALEVRKNDGRTIIIPLTEQVIKRIDKDKRCIVVSPGTLEDFS